MRPPRYRVRYIFQVLTLLLAYAGIAPVEASTAVATDTHGYAYLLEKRVVAARTRLWQRAHSGSVPGHIEKPYQFEGAWHTFARTWSRWGGIEEGDPHVEVTARHLPELGLFRLSATGTIFISRRRFTRGHLAARRFAAGLVADLAGLPEGEPPPTWLRVEDSQMERHPEVLLDMGTILYELSAPTGASVRASRVDGATVVLNYWVDPLLTPTRAKIKRFDLEVELPEDAELWVP